VEVDPEPTLPIRDENKDWSGETFLCFSVLAHDDMGSLRVFRVRHPIEMEAAPFANVWYGALPHLAGK